MAMITNAFIKMITGHDPKFSAITGKVARMYSQKYRSFATRQLAASFIMGEELGKFIAAAHLGLNIFVTVCSILFGSFNASTMFVIESTLLLQDSERKVLHADGQNVSNL